MTDLQAAVGIVQLGRLNAAVQRRRELAATYANAFAGVEGLRLVSDPEYGISNFQSCWLEVGPAFPLGRDASWHGWPRMASLPAAGSWQRTGSCVRRHGHRHSRAGRNGVVDGSHTHTSPPLPPTGAGRPSPRHRLGITSRGSAMSELLLIAASGLAREVLAMVRSSGPFDVIGILDDDEDKLGRVVDGGAHVLGPVREAMNYPPRPAADLHWIRQRPRKRGDAAPRLGGLAEDRYATAIDPSVRVPEGCMIGRGGVSSSPREHDSFGDHRRPRGRDARGHVHT